MNSYPSIQVKQKQNQNYFDNQGDNSRSYLLFYATKLVDFQGTIDTFKDIFLQDQIWPDQCDYIIYKIKPLQKTATSITDLALSAKRQGTRNSGKSRYALAICADYFYEQTSRLAVLVREYREVASQTFSKKSKRMSVLNSINQLELSLNDTLKELGRTAGNI
jgi:hypothetical protein